MPAATNRLKWKCFSRIISKLDRDQTVIDVGTGIGWAGQCCLKYGFKFVEFLDTRTYRITPFTANSNNYKITDLDITSDEFENHIKDYDVILYINHIDHNPDPLKTLKIIAKSNCKHLLLQSNVDSPVQLHEFHPPELIPREEKTVLRNAYHPTKETLTVFYPTLSWTKQQLTELGFVIESIETFSFKNPEELGEDWIGAGYFIHATK
jgi:2-polyprenyl-3-methyl-5-hydroxy-6-metoxy-1,4-benzoquinol methylase